ncbi:hypothetical protein Anas_13169 [Armadillidium nasatum]|uniref:Uncharacterized protein n=1 Tax=Armadillidium nasatum TaxID=96803 RepID=A0A5N5TBR3_9CRUS|nr:hypothetical protein Anas_13169 [Armadillidium nasatum]
MEKSDSSENKSSEDLSSEFIVEVSSVLDKLKNKITKSKSQIVVPDISETPEESEQLIGLIDKLKTSLSTVVESEGSLARENGKTKERDDSNSPYEHLDADDEDDSDLEDDLDTDDEECDTETVETVQTAILRSSENGLKNETKKRKEMEVEQRAKGIEDSLSSSGDDEIKYQENRSLSNSSDSKHQLQRQPSREEARSYLSSAIVKCKSREEMVKQGSDDYSDGKTEVETSERFESSPETDAKEKENAKKKDLKDLPWKIRAAKKRSQDQSQRHSVSGSSSPKFVPLALRRNSFEAVSNSKPRPFVAGTPIQSKSFGDVVQAITDEPANYESFSATQPVLNGNSAQPNDHEDLTSQKQTDDSEESGEDEEGQVFSIKSSEHESVLRKELPGIYHNQFKASINKPFNLLSKVNKKEVLKKSEMFKNPTTDDISSELKDSISLDGISHDISKSVPESNILDIYHNEQKSHLNKPVNLLQKLDKKEVRKKSELFSKASEEKNKRNHHHLPFVRNRSEEKYTNQNPLPRHSFQPLSNVPFSNIPPIDSMKFDLPFLSKRPTTLHLRTKVPDCRPVEFSDFIIDNHCPPIPTKGEVLTPPTVPKKSLNTSHNFQNRLTTSKSQEKINIPDDQVYKNTNMPFSLSRSKSSPIVIKESFLDNSLTSNMNQKINNLNLENKREKLQNALNKSDDSNLKPIFTYSDKTVKTNKVSEIQNKFESSSQNSYGLSQSLDQSRLNTSELNKNVNKDPSSLLFTEEQLVKIAIHKAAINKQLYEGENNRKIGYGRTKSVSEQNTNKSAAPFRRVNSIAGSEFLANSSHLREGHIEETKNYYNHESTMEQRHLQEQRQHQQKQQGKPKLQPAEKLNENEQHNRNVEKLQTEQQSLVHAQKGQYKLQENKNEIPITEHQLLEMQNRKEHDLLQKNLEKQKLEQIRLEEQKVEHERLKKQALEREKIEQHKREQQFERQRIEQERIEQQKKEQERIEQQKKEQERIEQQKKEQERIEQQKKEQERIEQQKKEQKRSEMLLKQQQLYEQQRKDQEQKILNQKISFVPGSNREAKRIQQMFEDQSKQESQEPIRTERSGRSQTKDTDTHISDSGINAKSLQKYHHYRSLSTSGKLHKENESASTRGASLGRSQESLNSEEEVFYDALTSGNDVSSIGGKRNLNSSQESTSKPVMQMMRGHVFSSSLPETSKKLSQTPEMTRKVYKPNVHRTNSLIEKSIRKISLQNDTKDEGLNEQSSFSFRNKSSSVSVLSDNQGSSYSSHSIQDIKLKNKPDFVVPPLPKTNFKQQKYEQQISQVKKNAQQYSNANIRNEKRQTSESKLENDSSNIKSKFTNYYVPPLPTTDFKRINDSKAERTKAFSVRTQSLSSLPPDTVGNANTGFSSFNVNKGSSQDLIVIELDIIRQ